MGHVDLQIQLLQLWAVFEEAIVAVAADITERGSTPTGMSIIYHALLADYRPTNTTNVAPPQAHFTLSNTRITD